MSLLSRAVLVTALLPALAIPAAAQGKKKKSGIAAGPVSGTSGVPSGASGGSSVTTGGSSGGMVGSTAPLGPYAGPRHRSWTACGGFDALSVVCAAVWVTVEGTTTSVGVLNLSGLSGLTAAGQAVTTAGQWVITKVGFDNVPSAVSTTGVGVTDGSWIGRGGLPGAWSAFDDGQFGGGERIDLGITSGNGVDGGIASSCAPVGTLPGGSNRLWMTPNPGCTAYSVGGGGGGGDAWLETELLTNAAWNPNAADVTLYFKAQNGPGGESYECVLGGATGRGGCYDAETYAGVAIGVSSGQVVPEPGTLVLMATGIAGLGALAWRRRATPR